MKRKLLILILMVFCCSCAFAGLEQSPALKNTYAVKSALHNAFWGTELVLKDHKSPNCEKYYVTNITPSNYERFQHNGIWYSKWTEIWTVQACKDEFKIKFDFFQGDNDESTCKPKVISKNGKSVE